MAVIPDLKTEPEATSEVLTLHRIIMTAAIEGIISWIVGVMENGFKRLWRWESAAIIVGSCQR